MLLPQNPAPGRQFVTTAPAYMPPRRKCSIEPETGPGAYSGLDLAGFLFPQLMKLLLHRAFALPGVGRGAVFSRRSVLAAALFLGGGMVLTQLGLKYIHPLSGAAISIPTFTLCFLLASPILLAGQTIVWSAVPGARSYDVMRTGLESVRLEGEVIRLDPVVALAERTTARSLTDLEVPAPGRVFVYVVAFDDGQRSGYGTESAGRERVAGPGGGGCP